MLYMLGEFFRSMVTPSLNWEIRMAGRFIQEVDRLVCSPDADPEYQLEKEDVFHFGPALGFEVTIDPVAFF